jgi:hypothetical protein
LPDPADEPVGEPVDVDSPVVPPDAEVDEVAGAVAFRSTVPSVEPPYVISPRTWAPATTAAKVTGFMPAKSALTLPSSPTVSFTPEPPSNVTFTPAGVLAVAPVLVQDPTGHAGTGGVVGVAVGEVVGVPVQAAVPTRKRPASTSGIRRVVVISISVRSLICLWRIQEARRLTALVEERCGNVA